MEQLWMRLPRLVHDDCWAHWWPAEWWQAECSRSAEESEGHCMDLILYVNGKLICRMSTNQLPHHTPPKRGKRRWRIVVEGAEDQVIDSYSPPREKKVQPITPYKGSWAESMKFLREGSQKAR